MDQSRCPESLSLCSGTKKVITFPYEDQGSVPKTLETACSVVPFRACVCGVLREEDGYQGITRFGGEMGFERDDEFVSLQFGGEL